ncbi:cobalamin B12-binding domain-containing protein [Streptomyces sp. NPDC003042]
MLTDFVRRSANQSPGRGVPSWPEQAPAGRRPGRPTAVVTTTPSDSHTWNLVFLQLLLEEHGYIVHNLGACVPVEELVDGCRRHQPDLLVLSSVNGHGVLEAPDCVRALRDAGLHRLRAVAGGKLTTDGALSDQQTTTLLEAGFDAVFTADQPVDAFARYLQQAAEEPAAAVSGAAV